MHIFITLPFPIYAPSSSPYPHLSLPDLCIPIFHSAPPFPSSKYRFLLIQKRKKKICRIFLKLMSGSRLVRIPTFDSQRLRLRLRHLAIVYFGENIFFDCSSFCSFFSISLCLCLSACNDFACWILRCIFSSSTLIFLLFLLSYLPLPSYLPDILPIKKINK